MYKEKINVYTYIDHKGDISRIDRSLNGCISASLTVVPVNSEESTPGSWSTSHYPDKPPLDLGYLAFEA